MRRIACALSLLVAPPAFAACPPVPEVAWLAAAILDRRPAPPPAALTLDEARCARDRLVAALAQPWGDQVGWKVQPGTPPLAGALFHGTLRLAAGETFPAGTAPVLPAAFGIVPQVAAGLVLRIRDEGINAAGGDHIALLRHVDAVIPFLDLTDRVQPETTPWTPELALSLNLGTRLGVLGEPMRAEPTPDFASALGAVAITLSRDGAEVARGAPTAHPLDALAWLLRNLAAEGRGLRAGDHVAIAGLTPPLAAAPATWKVSVAGLAGPPRQARVALR